MSNPNPPSGPGEPEPRQTPGQSQPSQPSYGEPYGQSGQPGQYGQEQYGQGQYGQGQPPPPPGQYGAPGGYQQPQKSSPLAITSLVTGIVGVVLCFCWSIPIFAIAALITGILGKNQIKAAPQQYKGGGMATAGIILGAIGVVIAVAYWIAFATGAFDQFLDYSFDVQS